MTLTRCSRCGSRLEEWELLDGHCPYCYPRGAKRVRALNDAEHAILEAAGCHNGHGPWALAMGVYFCQMCGESPPTHVRYQ